MRGKFPGPGLLLEIWDWNSTPEKEDWKKSFSWLLPKAVADTEWCTNMSLQMIPGKSPSSSMAGPATSPIITMVFKPYHWGLIWHWGLCKKSQLQNARERGGYRERVRERICNKQNKPPVPDESTILNSKTFRRKTMAKEKGERKEYGQCRQ